MKILKVITIIFVNLILLVMFLIPVEMYYVYKWSSGDHFGYNFPRFLKEIFTNKKPNIDFNRYKYTVFDPIKVDKYFDMLYSKQYVEGTLTNQFRPDENINSNKKPVVFMGCSMTFGSELNEKETVSAQFAKLTDRPTYNRAGYGWGLAQYLYQTRRDDFYTQIKEEPEYLIFTFIDDHVFRLDKFKIEPSSWEFQPKYIKKKGHLVEQKPKVYDRLFSVLDYQYFYEHNKHKIDLPTLKLYFTEARDAVRTHWKNTKLVILVYPVKLPSPTDLNIDNNFWSELEKEGYIVLNLENMVDVDLTDNKYKVDWIHPSAEAWSIILPKVIEKLDIN